MTHVYGCTNQMMLYGCTNQKHMLLWSRPEDVVQILLRMYFFLVLCCFQKTVMQIVNDFEENQNVTQADRTFCFSHWVTDRNWHYNPPPSVKLTSCKWWFTLTQTVHLPLFGNKAIPLSVQPYSWLMLYHSLPCTFSSEAMNHWLFNISDKKINY